LEMISPSFDACFRVTNDQHLTSIWYRSFSSESFRLSWTFLVGYSAYNIWNSVEVFPDDERRNQLPKRRLF
jgi:hypothetical protein